MSQEFLLALSNFGQEVGTGNIWSSKLYNLLQGSKAFTKGTVVSSSDFMEYETRTYMVTLESIAVGDGDLGFVFNIPFFNCSWLNDVWTCHTILYVLCER